MNNTQTKCTEILVVERRKITFLSPVLFKEIETVSTKNIENIRVYQEKKTLELFNKGYYNIMSYLNEDILYFIVPENLMGIVLRMIRFKYINYITLESRATRIFKIKSRVVTVRKAFIKLIGM